MAELTSRDNPKIKSVIKLTQDKKHRRAQNAFVCEGAVLLDEAVKSGMEILEVYATPKQWQAVAAYGLDNCHQVSDQLMAQMSGVETPQGIVFVCRTPQGGSLRPGNLIVLDNLRDNGNLGTIIRTAEGLGIANVALLGDCAELHSPKTIRASMGSIFRVNLVPVTLEQLLDWTAAQGMALYATALSQTSMDIRQADLKQAAVVIGNEAKGVSQQVLDAAHGHIIIPITAAQSFNASVAAAVVMWEMVR